jgi:hypothetical protein
VPRSIQQDVFWFQITVDDVLLVQMLDGQTELSNIKLGLILRESDFSCQVKAQVSAWTIVKGEIEVMRSLKGKVKVDDELVVCLLQDIGLDDCILQLFLQYKIFLFKCLESIQTAIDVQLCQENFAKSARA